MYESHFGISGPPFRLSPDPAFYFDSRGHREALTSLRHGLEERRGHLVVSGEIGAGKTLLIATLLAALDPEETVVGKLVSTQLDAHGLLRAVLSAFAGAERRGVDRGTDLVLALEAYLKRLAAEGRRALLFIDEAQNLDSAAMQRLAEIESGSDAAARTLTICLAGQPELKMILASPAQAALRARVAVECHLGPLGAMETGAYIAHRLGCVGWKGVPAFEADAIDEIHRHTGGIPRRINQLCNRLMLAAYLNGLSQIDQRLVDSTAAELRAEIGDLPPLPRPAPKAVPVPAPANRPAAEEAPSAPAQAPAATGAAATPPAVPPAPVAAPTVSLNLLPVDDVAPATTRVAPTPVVRFPSFAPWPTLPPVAVSPPVLRDAIETPAARPLLCVAGGQSDHIQAGALIRGLASQRELPPAWLVRAFANDALDRCRRLYRSIDLDRAISLGVPLQGTYADRASELMARFDVLLEQQRPSAVIVFDGGEAALAAGLVATRRHIPLLRVGAGRRAKESAGTGDLARKLSDGVADVLYASDAAASEQLVRDGLPTGRISLVGSVLVDALQLALREGTSRDFEGDLRAAVSQIASERAGYGVAFVENRANVLDRRTISEIVALLATVSRDVALIWPMHASTREQLLHLRLDSVIDRARIVPLPMQPYPAFAQLVAEATCVLTDSWNLQEETTALEVPCLTIGIEPGHPVTLAQGSNTFIGLNRMEATRAVWSCIFGGGKRSEPPRLWDGRASERIATHLSGFLARARATRT